MVGKIEIAVSRSLVLRARARLTHQQTVVEHSRGAMFRTMQEVCSHMQAKLDRLIQQHERLVRQTARTIPCPKTS